MSKTGWVSVGERGDRSQDLAGRRLLLERLGQLAVPRVELLEQTHVLDRDHRLVREGLQKPDLLIREGADFASPHRDDADRDSLPEQGNSQIRAVPAQALVDLALRELLVGFGCQVVDVDGLPVHNGPPRDRILRSMGMPSSGHQRASMPCERHDAQHALGRPGRWRRPWRRTAVPHSRRRRRERAGCRWASRLMTRRIAPVAVCCSSASVSSRFRASSSLNSRTFSIAITAWSAKVSHELDLLVREGPDLTDGTATMAPMAVALPQQRYCQCRPIAQRQADRRPRIPDHSLTVGDLHDPVSQRLPGQQPSQVGDLPGPGASVDLHLRARDDRPRNASSD